METVIQSTGKDVKKNVSSKAGVNYLTISSRFHFFCFVFWITLKVYSTNACTLNSTVVSLWSLQEETAWSSLVEGIQLLLQVDSEENEGVCQPLDQRQAPLRLSFH